MADKETVIGLETQVSGEIHGEEDLVVKGRIDGKVHLQNALTVEKGGIVQADVDVKRLVVAGTLVGSVVASESIRLQSSARVVGDLASPRVIMEAGAAYRGRVDMGDIEAARAAVASRPVARPVSTAPARERPAPPRMMAPPRPTTAAPVKPVAKLPEKSVETAPPAPPPAFPRVAGAVGGAAPAWAKKKLVRRR